MRIIKSILLANLNKNSHICREKNERDNQKFLQIMLRNLRYTLNTTTPEAPVPTIHYELTNHLGNVMAVITDEPTDAETPAVESLTDYYPFGMTMPGRSYNAHTLRHGFTGHEKESDLAEGIYTTEYRLYDARVARWLSVDPLFEKYVSMSPYNYCMLNPVMMVDPDGRSLAVLQAPKGAVRQGHLAILIQNKDGKWALYSKNGTNEKGGIKGKNVTKDNYEKDGKRIIDKGQHTFDSVKDFLNNDEHNPIDEDGERQYTEAFVIECGPEIDREAEIGAKSVLDEDYDVLDSNCAQVVQAALKQANTKRDAKSQFDDGSEEKHSIDFEKGPIKIHKKFSTPNLRPNKIYETIKKNNNGKVIEVDD